MILIQLADTLEYIAGHLFNLTDLLPYIFIINNMSYPNTIGIYSICIQEMITPAILFTTHIHYLQRYYQQSSILSLSWLKLLTYDYHM